MTKQEKIQDMGKPSHSTLLTVSIGRSWLWEAREASSLPQTQRQAGELSLKSLTFGPSVVWRWTKRWQLQKSPLTFTGALPLHLARGSTPDPHYRLALHVCHGPPPLANPGSAAVMKHCRDHFLGHHVLSLNVINVHKDILHGTCHLFVSDLKIETT